MLMVAFYGTRKPLFYHRRRRSLLRWSARKASAVKALFSKICGERGVGDCVDGDRFNTWGYNLFGQHRPKDALAVFEIAAWAHPTSANAQDSLADGYLAAGDKESAKRALQRAIDLAPEDPLIESGSKASFISDESKKLRQPN